MANVAGENNNDQPQYKPKDVRRAAGDRMVLVVDAALLAASPVAIAFDFDIVGYEWNKRSAAGLELAIGADSLLPDADNANQLELTLAGGGLPDLIATDVLNITAWG